ncbi:hypothetical protein RDV89_03130 [Nocardioides zeae]|uniref:DUF4190 domain-containing protein n=1 Tax=Nocardioides imazamoxiresistens TaxID=3231893 RepID=A0ABU3PS42_9ACTN|nr:hypothetical protein [Nocardioides zeae]MDT9592043.1 hypothetical protein [Nocardioides zeae]
MNDDAPRQGPGAPDPDAPTGPASPWGAGPAWGSPGPEAGPPTTPYAQAYPQTSPYSQPYGQPYAQQPGQPAGYVKPASTGPVPYLGFINPPDHPQATTALVLGAVGLFLGVSFMGLGLLVSPFAWGVGAKALREIEASNGALGGESAARAGKIMGIVGSVLLALAVLAVAALIAALAVSTSP